MNKVILSIDGMSCSACSNAIEKYLNKQEGVISASVNLVLARALIEYDDSITIDDLNRFISEAGYKSLGIYDEKKELKNKKDKPFIISFGILTVVLMYLSMFNTKFNTIEFFNMKKFPLNYSLFMFVFASIFLLYGIDILKSGIRKLIHKAPNMDTLVTIGVMSSFIYSIYELFMIFNGKYEYAYNLYFDSVIVVIYFVKIGRFIDSKNKEKTKEAIKELVQITPKFAVIKKNDTLKNVTIDEVKKGDILVCKPGEKISVDGIITKGETHLDVAFITGESTLENKKVNDKVLAGSFNLDGYIEYKAEKIGKDSNISEIVKIVVEATNTKAPSTRIADKVSGVFVPFVIFISIITFLIQLIITGSFNHALTYFITVLVVACPCALGLATPLAIIVSEGFAAKNGILIKTSEILENASKIDTVVFDKTGTITKGKPSISKVYNFSDHYTTRKLLNIVSSIESGVNHPISLAFSNYAKEKNIKLDKFEKIESIDGMGLKTVVYGNDFFIGNKRFIKKIGIRNEYKQLEEELSKDGNSIVYVIENDVIIALIGVKDVIRDEAKQIVSELNKIGIDVLMLTGDNENTAKKVADEIKIRNYYSEVLPIDKLNQIKRLISSGKKVMMVGDGINDAPSLASATIGVSVGSGADIAANSSDVILINNNLINILNLIKISKKTRINIKENLFWAFFYNICMLPVAAGLFQKINISMNPMIASFAMTLSSLTVVVNALRLKKIKLWRKK